MKFNTNFFFYDTSFDVPLCIDRVYDTDKDD